ncbi:MAG: SIMPL domain-containing protein [Deltaproteobacteria bacterium]|nr:SIMPL domain-containing protein [Deltaproteobacteria bacterium]
MTRPRLAALVAALILCLLTPWTALAESPCPEPPTLTVTGQADLELTPDQVSLNVGVATRASTAKEASQANATIMEGVKAAIKPLLGPQDRLQTASYWLRATTQWDEVKRTSHVVGYEAVNTLKVTSRQAETIGQVLDAAVKAGANQVSGPNWSLADPRAGQQKVQALAYDDALAQAQALAQKAGMKLGPPLSLQIGEASPPPRPMMAAMRATGGAANTKLEAGEISLSATVVCRFLLLSK